MRMGAKGAVAMARHPKLRRATVRAAKPPAKLGWRVGKFIVKRKARARAQQLGETGATAASLALLYGKMVGDVFGLIDTPRPRRRGPAFVAGVAIGAGAMYAAGRANRD
jgi:hypothetical protein